MKKAYLLLACLGVIATAAMAQQKTPQKTTPDTKKQEKKEITIEEKSGKTNEKTVIVIEGNKVTINGKPADQYQGKKHIVIDDDVVINGNHVMVPHQGGAYNYSMTAAKPKAMLGVVTEQVDKGAKVTEVMDESAAEKAGLKEGDIITGVNETKITGTQSLQETIRKFKPQETVDVTYLREGKEKKVKATLGRSEEAFALSNGEDFMKDFNIRIEPPMAFAAPYGLRGYAIRDDRPKFGMGVEDNPDGDGAKVSSIEPESQAAKAGLQKDDIITEVEGENIENIDELRRILAESHDKSSLALKVQRGGKTESLTLRVPKRIKTADL
jgi:serine protease Do